MLDLSTLISFYKSQSHESLIIHSLPNQKTYSSKSPLQKFLNGQNIDHSEYSPEFLDLLSSCLLLDPTTRPHPIQLLSHPIFKQANKTYLSYQVIASEPITAVEKQYIGQWKWKGQKKGFGLRQLLEISKLKSCVDNQTFIMFLKDSFEKIHQSKIKDNEEEKEQLIPYESLILKPDLQQELDQLNTLSDDSSLYEETKSMRSNESSKEHSGAKGMVGSQSTLMVSDAMSTQSSFLDRISSIFTFGRNASTPQAQNSSLSVEEQKKQVKGSQEDKSNTSTGADKKQIQMNRESATKRYLILSKFIRPATCNQTKLVRIVRASSEFLPTCPFLMQKVWLKLLGENNPFQVYLLQIINDFDEEVLNVKESTQIWSDIKRCESFHPLIESEEVKKRLHSLLKAFLVLNEDACYIQGMDSITVVLYTLFQGQDHLILPLLKHLYTTYLKPFIDKDTNNLSFAYPCLLVQRLLAFYEPELFNHFNAIDFSHNLFLVRWVMTLFAHILPLESLYQVWTDLFCEKVEYLFFLSIALLSTLKDKLLLLDLNGTLGFITNISDFVDTEEVIKVARHKKEHTPQSFIVGEFVFDASKSLSNLEALKQNEYFASRWWELEYLDYREDIEVCLISAEDALSQVGGGLPQKNRILIDVRQDFEEYHSCHLKNSYFMLSNFQDNNVAQEVKHIQFEFLQLYHENYPDNLIIIIGDNKYYGHEFALQAIKEYGSVGRICIVKGGIDAFKLEFPHLLRKGQKNQQPIDFYQQYERFVKKAKLLRSQKGTQQKHETPGAGQESKK